MDRAPTSSLRVETSLDTASLSPFQRILLGTNGTVTHVLEAYTGEPVEVVKLFQELDTSDDGDADLGCGDAKVLRRRVLLRGTRTGRNLVYAEAVVVLDRVDPSLVDGLVATDRPIGLLLAEHRMETFREILRAGREPAGPLGPHFGVAGDEQLLFRTYRIVAGGRPIILITEKFPGSFFLALPDAVRR